MTASFFERPRLNSLSSYPSRHWELHASGQPTGRLVEERRRAKFITPIPSRRRRTKGAKRAENREDDRLACAVC